MKSTGKNEKDLNQTQETERREYEPAKPEFRAMQMASHDTLKLKTVPQFTGGKTYLVEVEQARKSWIIDEIRSLPLYPLERPVEIADPPQVVATRICDSNRLRSISANYSNCEAQCKNSSYSKFVVNLYAGSNNGTIVEVMRLSGCGLAYRKEREAIINAAQGLGSVIESKFPCNVMRIPDEFLKKYQPPTRNDQEEVLSRAVDRIHSQHRDERLFTLQNLSSLTSSDKVNCESARQLSELILLNTFDIRDIMFELINVVKPECDEINCKTQNACVSIFANCLINLSQSRELEQILEQGNNDFVEPMVRSLFVVIKKCYCPFNTSISLECLGLLLKCSPIAHSQINEEYKMFVRKAESIGEQRHRNLELKAKLALEAMN